MSYFNNVEDLEVEVQTILFGLTLDIERFYDNLNYNKTSMEKCHIYIKF